MSDDSKGHAECVATILKATDYIRKLETQGDAAQARIKELEKERDRLYSDWSLEKERARLQTKALSDALCQLDSTDCTHRELSGRHCLVEKPCMRCKLEAQVQRLVEVLEPAFKALDDTEWMPADWYHRARAAMAPVHPAKDGGEG